MRKLHITAVSVFMLMAVLACSRPSDAPPLVPSSTTALVTPDAVTLTPNAVVKSVTNTPGNNLSSDYEILRNRYYTFTHGVLIDEWQALGPDIAAHEGVIEWRSGNVEGLQQQIYLPDHAVPYDCTTSVRYLAQGGGLSLQVLTEAGTLLLNFEAPIKPLYQNYVAQFQIAAHITAVRFIIYAQRGDLDEASLRCAGLRY
jgi:hypothetical protein